MSHVTASRLLAVVLVASLAPAAPVVAQPQTGSASVDISLPTLAAPVPPTGPQNTTATVRYSWEDSVSQQNVTIELSYTDGPSWLNSSFRPSTVEIDMSQRGSSGVETRIVNVTLEVSPSATAYANGTAIYTAEASSSGTIPPAESENGLPLTAGFAGRLVATLPQGGNVTAWGGVLTEVPLHVENTANGPIEVRVRVDRSPADARLFSPGTVQVGHEPGNRTRTAQVGVRTPWSVSLEGPVEVQLLPEHATRGTELSPQRVGFTLEGQSAVPIPSVGPAASLAALGLAFLVRGSRKRSS